MSILKSFAKFMIVFVLIFGWLAGVGQAFSLISGKHVFFGMMLLGALLWVLTLYIPRAFRAFARFMDRILDAIP